MQNLEKLKLSYALIHLFFVFTIFLPKEVNAQDYYLDFNKGDRVETGITVSELDGATTFTFETKIYLETLPAWTNILSKAVSNTDRISLQLNAGQLYCIVADGTNSFRRTPGAPLTINTWYHLAMVYDGSLSGFDKLKLYIDGIEQTNLEDSGAVTLPTTTPSNAADFRLAMAWNYEGGIDEVRVWDLALTSTNINAWKNKQLDNTHPNYTNLKLYWNLDDFDTPAITTGTEGTSYNGTIVGATYKEKEVTPNVPVDQRVIGYLPHYRMSTVASGIFDHLTHLNYFSIAPNSSGELGRRTGNTGWVPLSSVPQIQIDLNSLKSLRGTRTTKIFVTFGGWYESDFFDEMAADVTSRANFVQNVKDYLITNGLDGADIDWEEFNGPVVDANYGLLLEELKSAFSGTGLGLTVAIGKSHTSLADEFTPNVDHIGLMSYGPIFDDGMQVSLAQLQGYVYDWIAAGVPVNKIIVGVPFYGRTPSDGTAITYRQIIDTYNPANSVNSVVDIGKTYYYNGIDAIKAKAQYVKDGNLGGIMIWEIGQDVAITHAKSLLNAITQVIPVNVTLGTDDFKLKENLLNVFPNPFTETINLTLQVKNSFLAKVAVYDTKGAIVWQKEKFQDGLQKLAIDCGKLSTGIYILKVFDGEGMYTRKLIKKG